jgi:hypothetical protein
VKNNKQGGQIGLGILQPTVEKEKKKRTLQRSSVISTNRTSLVEYLKQMNIWIITGTV